MERRRRGAHVPSLFPPLLGYSVAAADAAAAACTWSAITAIVPILGDSDPYLDHSARVALRRIGHFDESAKAGLASANASVRKGTLVMLEQQYDLKAAKALADYASDVSNPAAERAMAVTYLAEVHRKIPPWDGSWWGTRPTRGIIPAKVDSWEGSDFVLSQIRNRLADPVQAR